MTNLARFDPYTMMRMDPFENIVRDFMPTNVRSLLQPVSTPAIAIEVQEMDKAYLIAAELPGVEKKDINISISGNMVTLSAECKHEKMTVGAKEWCNERSYGMMSRTVQLPTEIDDKHADASYSNGVLHLTLPKKTSTMGKKLEIR